MDYNRQWSRNMPEQQVEDWRTQRDQKMASRPQYSDRPRTSVEQYGYGNHRQPMHPSHRPHSNGPRYNHTDQRWNTNYNYSGYREHHSPHKQYQSEHRPDNHHRGHGSFHHNGQKRINFNSPKSQHNERKPNSNLHKKYSNCSINTNSGKTENQTVSNLSEQQCGEATLQPSVTVPVPDVDRLASKPNIDAGDGLTLSCIDSTVELDNEKDEISSDCKESEKLVNVETQQPSLSENETLSICIDSKSVVENLEEPRPCLDLVQEDVACSADKAITCENVELNVELDNSKSDGCIIESIDEKTTVTIDAKTVNTELIELAEHSCLEQSQVTHESEVQSVECTENASELLITEPSRRSEDEKSVTSNDEGCYNSEIALNVDNSAVEPPVLDAEHNETGDIELHLSYGLDEDAPCLSVEATSDTDIADSVPQTTELQQEEKGNEDAIQEPLTAASNEDTDVSEVIGKEEALTKELEHVESKLANISIAQKNDAGIDNESSTPLKREKKKALIDATNILPSSTIKYAVREIRKNDESEIVVTPVRRSLRLSSVTPVSRKNVVQNLEELTPEIKQKMKFKLNPAINDSDC